MLKNCNLFIVTVPTPIYKNKNPEKDPIIWGFNSIWYGRATQQFKTLPQNILSDYEQVISQQTVKLATFLSP